MPAALQLDYECAEVFLEAGVEGLATFKERIRKSLDAKIRARRARNTMAPPPHQSRIDCLTAAEGEAGGSGLADVCSIAAADDAAEGEEPAASPRPFRARLLCMTRPALSGHCRLAGPPARPPDAHMIRMVYSARLKRRRGWDGSSRLDDSRGPHQAPGFSMARHCPTDALLASARTRARTRTRTPTL